MYACAVRQIHARSGARFFVHFFAGVAARSPRARDSTTTRRCLRSSTEEYTRRRRITRGRSPKGASSSRDDDDAFAFAFAREFVRILEGPRARATTTTTTTRRRRDDATGDRFGDIYHT